MSETHEEKVERVWNSLVEAREFLQANNLRAQDLFAIKREQVFAEAFKKNRYIDDGLGW